MFCQSEYAGAVNIDVRVSIRLNYSVDTGIVASHNDRLYVLQLTVPRTAWKMISKAALDGKGLEELSLADLEL